MRLVFFLYGRLSLTPFGGVGRQSRAGRARVYDFLSFSVSHLLCLSLSLSHIHTHSFSFSLSLSLSLSLSMNIYIYGPWVPSSAAARTRNWSPSACHTIGKRPCCQSLQISPHTQDSQGHILALACCRAKEARTKKSRPDSGSCLTHFSGKCPSNISSWLHE